jgi:hypothetical protein
MDAEASAFADMVSSAVVAGGLPMNEATLDEHRAPVACVYRAINSRLYLMLRQAGVSREKISGTVLANIKESVGVKMERAKRSKSHLP